MLYHIEQYSEDNTVVFEATEDAVRRYYDSGGLWFYGDIERFDQEGQTIIKEAIKQGTTRNSLE